MADALGLLQRTVVDECDRALRFLVEEHGFAGPELDTSHRGSLRVLYAKGRVGVECIHESADDDLSVYVVRLWRGRPPKDWRRDADGVRVRALLTTVLRERDVPRTCCPPPSTDWERVGRAAYRRLLQRAADLLTAHAPDVLGGSAEILDEGREATVPAG